MSLLSMCSSFILLTWPYHFSRCSVIVLHSCTTLVVPLMCSFRILSLLVTPHIHICILISFTSSRASCPLVVAQVSAPYNISGLTTVFVNHPLLLHWHPPVIQQSTASLPVSTCCTHSVKIYVVIAPVSSTLAPRYLKRCTRCSSSPRILTGSSLAIILSKCKVYELSFWAADPHASVL